MSSNPEDLSTSAPVISVTKSNKSAYAELREAEAGAREWADSTGNPVAPPAGPIAMLGYRFLLLIARFFGSTAITVDDLHVVSKQGDVERRFEWADFNGWFQTENYACLMIKESGAPLVIPKAALSESDLASLRTLLTNKLD